MYSEITKKTFNLIFEKRYVLTKALFIPFIFLTIIEYFLTPLIEGDIGGLNFYILVGISSFITIIISITVHRILLLDEDSVPTWGMYSFGKREISFIFNAIGLILLLGLVGVGIGLIVGLVGGLISSLFGDGLSKVISIAIPILVLLFIGTIFTRISLVFPSISIDKPLSFSDAYSVSKDHKLLTFLMIGVIPIVLGGLLGLAYGLVIEFLMGIISQKLSVLYSLLNIFITVLAIGFLSVTYKYIMGKQITKTKEETPIKEITFEEGENSFKMFIDNRHNINFNEIKENLQEQYSSLGFNNIVLDKENSWMLKNSENEEAYILLSHTNNEYKIETFKVVQKPVIII